MGRNKWQWLAVVALWLAAAVLAGSAGLCEESASSTSTEPAAGTSETDPAAAETAPEEQPPLDLGTGTTADSASPTDPLAEGVTVSKTGESTSPSSTPETDGAALVIPPLWTPNSSRFLLRDQMETLSLTTDADASEPADKPATKPKPAAAKPKPTPPAKPKPAVSQPAVAAADTGANPTEGLVERLELPEATLPAAPPPEVIPSEQFSDSELLSGESDSFVLDGQHGLASPASTSLGLPAGSGEVGVIVPHDPNATGGQSRQSLRDSLAAGDQTGSLGSGVPQISYWKSGAVVLALLALWLVGAWLARRFGGSFKLGGNKPLSVLETISLGAGRQITIVEMGECALVLGVTPQSINLLDKVPLSVINLSYKGTVNAIIDKERRALPDDWAQQPRFTVPENTGSASLVPPLAAGGTYGPNGQRVSVGELRRVRSGTAAADSTFRPRPAGGGDEQTKTELIGRLRDQLNRLEQ